MQEFWRVEGIGSVELRQVERQLGELEAARSIRATLINLGTGRA